MSRHFASTVHVLGDDGQYHVFGPHDDVPDWAASKVGDHVWAEDDDGVPPKSGKGSGIEAWKAYADSKGIGYDPDASREDVVAALEAAGVPTDSE